MAPISLTWASLVDAMTRSKRMIIRLPDDPLEYNTMLLAPDELGAFIHKWDEEMTKGLSAMYDPDPYSQERRGGEIKIKIKSPQLNILSGTTPQDLLSIMPESAWGQGFTSRVIMIFSDERIVGDDFEPPQQNLSLDLLHDLKHINMLVQEYKVTEDFRNLVKLWRDAGEQPSPNHPKLIHYCSRRRVNLYKLCMISAIDRSDTPLLTREDFNRAMNWLVEAETYMPDIFKAGATGTDSQAMDEIYHFALINDKGSGVAEPKLVNFARDRVPAHSIMRVLEIMERSGQIKAVRMDKTTGMRLFKAITAQPS